MPRQSMRKLMDVDARRGKDGKTIVDIGKVSNMDWGASARIAYAEGAKVGEELAERFRDSLQESHERNRRK